MTLRYIKWVTIAIPLVFALACMAGQSEQDGMQLICDAHLGCESCESDATKLDEHIQNTVHNGAALEAFTAVLRAPPDRRGIMLRARSQALELDSCALADLWEKQSKQVAAASLCNLSALCPSFDKTDLSTLDLCLSKLDPLADLEARRMPRSSIAAFARSVEAYSSSNGQDNCKLVLDLRSP